MQEPLGIKNKAGLLLSFARKKIIVVYIYGYMYLFYNQFEWTMNKLFPQFMGMNIREERDGNVH